MVAVLAALRRPEWRLCALLLVCYVYFLPRFADWSQASRAAVVLAVVHDGRLSIDEYGWATGDYADFNGRRYSDKAPGPSLLAVPVYAAARVVLASAPGRALTEYLSGGDALRGTLRPDAFSHEKLEFAIAQLVATWAVVSVPAAIFGAAYFAFLRRLTGSAPTAVVVTLAYALGTSAFPYAGALYSHQLCAALLFGGVILLWRARAPGAARLLTVGLMLGVSVISEYPTALIVGGIGLYALAKTRRIMTGLLLGVGMVPPLAGMAVYNLLIFGTPLPVGYAHSALWQNEHQTGFFSLSYPTLDAFWGVTFSTYRGLLFMSPVLLLGLPGLVLLARRRGYFGEVLLCAWCVLSFVAFNSSTLMWSGGFGVGPRYLVPMLPFLAVGVAVAVERWRGSRWFRVLFGLLLAWSFGVTWALTIGGQHFPTVEPFPFRDVALPALAHSDIARNLGTLVGLRGWWSLLPLAALVVLLVPGPWPDAWQRIAPWARRLGGIGVRRHTAPVNGPVMGQ